MRGYTRAQAGVTGRKRLTTAPRGGKQFLRIERARRIEDVATGRVAGLTEEQYRTAMR